MASFFPPSARMVLSEAARALASGKAAPAIDALRHCERQLATTSLAALHARLLAQAYLANGDYRDGLTAAKAAVLAAQARLPRGRRQFLSALIVLARAEGLSEVVNNEAAADRAVRFAAEAGSSPLAKAQLAGLRAGGLSAEGRLEEARSALEGQDVLRASLSRGARRETLNLDLQLAIIDHRSAAFPRAAEAFARIALERALLLGADHPDTLVAIHNGAVAVRRTSRRGQALAMFEDVVTRRRMLIGASHPDTLISRSLLAVQLSEAGRAIDVLDEIEDVLFSARRRLGDGHTVTIQTAARTASVLERAGRPQAALAVLAEWAPRARDVLGPSHPETGALLHEFGGALRNAGRLGEAYRIFGALAEATRVQRGEAHIETLATYNNLAVVASDLGDNATAEAIYVAMLEQFDTLGDAYAPDRASVRNNLAQLLLSCERGGEARPLFEAVLAARSQRLEPGNRLLHLSRSNLAASLAKEGRVDDALALHRQVLDDRTKLYGAQDPDTLASLHNVAATLRDSGRTNDAVAVFERLAALRAEVLGPRHPQTLASARGLADTLCELGRIDEGEKAYRVILAIVEDARKDGDLPDELRRSLFAQYVPVYRSLALLAASQGQTNEVFDLVELVKARTLLERSVNRSAVRSRLIPDDQARRIQGLERKAASLEARIPFVDTVAERNALTAERDAELQAWRSEDAAARKAFPAYARASAIRTVSLDEGLSAVPHNEVFVSFVVQDDAVACVWILGDRSTGSAHLGRLPGLKDTVEAFRVLLSTPDAASGLFDLSGEPLKDWRLSKGSYKAAASSLVPVDAVAEVIAEDEITLALSHFLLDRLPPEAFRGQRLFLSADGSLARLPFEALRIDGRRLVHSCEVAYVASLSVAAAVRPDPERTSTIALIAFGDPIFEGAHDMRASSQASSLARAPLSSFGWADLPGAGREMAAVAEIYGLVEGATVFTREAASLQSLRRLSTAGRLSQANNLLFSTHGIVDALDPRRSAIVLGCDGDGDGRLTAAEIASFDLSADLVVLSACDTGARKASGEGRLAGPG